MQILLFILLGAGVPIADSLATNSKCDKNPNLYYCAKESDEEDRKVITKELKRAVNNGGSVIWNRRGR